MKFKIGNKEYDIADDVISAAIAEKKSELSLTQDSIVIRTVDEDNRFVENMKKDARKEGIEIAVKKSRETLGLSFDGKTIDNLIDAVTAKAKEDAKTPEVEKVTALEKKLKEKDAALSAALSKSTEAETKIKSLKTQYKVDSVLNTVIPKNVVLPVDDIKLILKSKLRFEETEAGAIEVYDSNGAQIVNPQTRDALPVKDVIENFFRDNAQYVKAVGGGSGAGDSGGGSGGSKMSIEDFNKDMLDKGHAINSPGYAAEMNKAIAAKTLDID